MRAVIMIVMCVTLLGCRSQRHVIRECGLYDSGEPMMEAESYSEGAFVHTSKYFKNGRLKLEEWSKRGQPLVRLCFYDNGQLKSEERWFNDHLEYGTYYNEEGALISASGKRRDCTLSSTGR